jgi:hypothetical protein
VGNRRVVFEAGTDEAFERVRGMSPCRRGFRWRRPESERDQLAQPTLLPDAELPLKPCDTAFQPAHGTFQQSASKHGVIVDVEVTTGEVNEGQVIVERIDACATTILVTGERRLGRTGWVFRPGLMHADATVGPEGVSDVPVCHLEVEPLRVEVATGPALGVAVLGIVGVGDDVEEPGVAVDTTNILVGRARAPSRQLAARGGGSRVSSRSNSTTWSQLSPKS